jgi:hypothetical protein
MVSPAPPSNRTLSGMTMAARPLIVSIDRTCLESADVLELLIKAPDPAAAAKLTTAQVSSALSRAHRRHVVGKTAVIRATLRAPQLTQPAPVTAACAAVVRALTAPARDFEIADVCALTSISTGTLNVTFEARDISWNPVNTSPPFIPVFIASDGSRFEWDVSKSIYPSSLQPGQSAAVSIGFDTTQMTGQFILTENGPGNTIVSTTLHTIKGLAST